MKNWIYDVLVKDKDKYKDFTMIKCTSYDNPYTPQDYKDGLKALYKGAFYRQEVLAEFESFEGQIFDNFSEDLHVMTPEEIEQLIEDKAIQGFILCRDLGFDPDPASSLAVGIGIINGLPHYFVMEEVYRKKTYVVSRIPGELDWITIDTQLVQKYKKKGLRFLGTYMETADSSGTRSQYNRAGFSIKKIDKNIDEGISTVHSFLTANRLKVSSQCENTIKEFLRYERGEDGEPVGNGFDHCMDALRYGVHTREHKKIEELRRNYSVS